MGAGFGVGEEVEGVTAVPATTVFLGECSRDFGEGVHAFVELDFEAELDGGGEDFGICGEHAVAGDAGGLGDFLVIACLVGDAWGVVRFAGPVDGHEASEEIAVVLEVENGLVSGAPHAEAGLADDGGILPTDAEVDFGVDAIASVEQRPCTAAAEACLFFKRPLAEGNERGNGTVDDEFAGDGVAGDVEPAAGKIDA